MPQNEHIPFDFSVLEYVLMGRSPHIATIGMPSQADYMIAVQSIEEAVPVHTAERLRIISEVEEPQPAPGHPRIAEDGRDAVDILHAFRQNVRVALLDLVDAEYRSDLGLDVDRRLADDVVLLRPFRVLDKNLEDKAVLLGLGQGVSSFLLDRILCREYKEGIGKRMALSSDGDLSFLHRLQ